jgi:hypothetical protein
VGFGTGRADVGGGRTVSVDDVGDPAGDLLATLELADTLPPGELGRTIAPLWRPSPVTGR